MYYHSSHSFIPEEKEIGRLVAHFQTFLNYAQTIASINEDGPHHYQKLRNGRDHVT